MNRAVERKVRVDKKRDVKPLIETEVKEVIHRISHITHMPIKDVSEFLTVYAFKDRQTIDKLSEFFRRSIVLDTTFYNGDINAPPITKRLFVNRGKVSIKFKRKDFEVISALAYAMDCTPTRVTAILLTSAAGNVRAVNAYVKSYLQGVLTNSQISELRQVLMYVHRYDKDNHSWASLLSTIIGDVRPAMQGIREMVDDFLRSHKH